MMKPVFLLYLLAWPFFVKAQYDRYQDYNNVNWAQLFVTKKLASKTDWLIEYQLRRTNGLKNWQQGLFRTAIQYKASSALWVAAGYAQAETFAYGDFPIAANGTFPEHRLFEQVTLRQEIKPIAITHRFRIEQRFIGKVVAGTDREIEEWIFSNRFRYMLRLQHNFNTKWYAWAADELMLNAGKKVGVNIFDQNRLHTNVGCKINKHVAVEFGYINQTLQQGRRINNQTIIQRNNGLVLATLVNF
ncbi:MAG: hypothetical protein RL115_416 [Bacteroidota bacterium]